MAAAYAALLSLFHTLDNINQHPHPPISLDQQHLHSLTQNITFLQEFLENYPSSDTQEDDDRESRIAAAVYAAEDLIETHIVDQIHHARSTSNPGKCISSVELYEGLESVIQDMDSIRKEVAEIKFVRPQHQHLLSNSSLSPAAGVPDSSWQSSIAPVFDDAMHIKVLDKLIGQQSDLHIVPIVGMGGIGKTTFAKYIYQNPLIVEHFDTMAWVTISQERNARNILETLWKEVKGTTDGLSEMSEEEIGTNLYQHLYGGRYLIVIDDIWNVEAWDEFQTYFPKENNGSRIMITTRLSNLAFELSGSHEFHMQFLDGDKSWDLFCEVVFGKQDCPIELEDIGKKIATKCRGLPLSIVLIGGLLKKSNMTHAYWLYTFENLNVIINLENDEYALHIVSTSYKALPMYLKPCFLYMGVFPEDSEIILSRLVNLWVAEGILKPIDGKSLEEVAEEYFNELIERNLIVILQLQWNANAKSCKMHDLLRDLCLREAQKKKFFCLVRQLDHHFPDDINMERRICINPGTAFYKYPPELIDVGEFVSVTRSLLYKGQSVPLLYFRLLRVYSPIDTYSLVVEDLDIIFEQANLRNLTCCYAGESLRFHSFCSLLWNLQTLNVFCSSPVKLTFGIWDMPLLRYVCVTRLVLPNPPNEEHNPVLEKLHTLLWVCNFNCNEEVVKRIPNVKKLEVNYTMLGVDDNEVLPNFCLNNLDRLQKLESLSLVIEDNFDVEKVMRNSVSFPHSLKELTLYRTHLNWEELGKRIGSLPLLYFLRLETDACVGARWETGEEQFRSLRVLGIHFCTTLKYWETDRDHFPCLTLLVLQGFKGLEIPSCIGDLPKLTSIILSYCDKLVGASAKRIIEEQKEYGNEDLHLLVMHEEDEKDLEKSDQVSSEFVDFEEEEEDLDEEGDQVVSAGQGIDGDEDHGVPGRSFSQVAYKMAKGSFMYYEI